MTLRRQKSDKEADGRPIVVLPPKTVRVVQCAFTPEERDFYESMEKRTQAQFQKYVREGWAQNYAHILVRVLIIRLPSKRSSAPGLVQNITVFSPFNPGAF